MGDTYPPDDFLRRVKVLTAKLPAGNAIAAFELACANDSTGHADGSCAALYRQALAAGLTGLRRRRAVIQLASTSRNPDQAHKSVALLTAERAATSDDLDDAVAATLALALVDTGREREAVSVALVALAPPLKRYNRSMANCAKALVGSK